MGKYRGRKVIEAIEPIGMSGYLKSSDMNAGHQIVSKVDIQTLLCKRDNAAYYHAGGALANAFQRALNA